MDKNTIEIFNDNLFHNVTISPNGHIWSACGNFVKVPCKIGDTVWAVKSRFSIPQEPIEYKITQITITEKDIIIKGKRDVGERTFFLDEFFKYCYKTREEAMNQLDMMGEPFDIEEISAIEN